MGENLKVVKLDDVRKEKQNQAVQVWEVFFQKLLSLIQESDPRFAFCLLIREPLPDDPDVLVENLFPYHLTPDEIIAFLERAKLTLLTKASNE